jgi:periplasmic copper chaperone A
MSIKILTFAAGLVAASTALAQPSQLEVDNAWAGATPGGAENGAAYVRITSPTADRLVSASTPVAKKTELHTMSMQGMVMKMRPVSGVDIPAGQPVSLKPGGEHIMLMGLNQPLREGQSFPLTLDFEKAGPRTVTVTVEKAGAKGPGPAAAQH